MAQLDGQYWLITGATRGLGLALTHAFWQNGTNLLLIARDAAQLQKLQTELQSSAKINQSCQVLAADLADPAAANVIAAWAAEQAPHLNGLLNNAGIQGPIGTIADVPFTQWQDTLQVNLYAPIQLTQTLLPLLRKASGKKTIINLSGGGSTGSRPRFAPYALSKTALVRFTEILADELRDENIQVNAIAPGAMATDMLKEVVSAGAVQTGEKEQQAAEKAFTQGDAVMQKAAALAVYLASDAAAAITGKLISAPWDPWPFNDEHKQELNKTDIFTLRRIVPQDRDQNWDK